MRSGMPESMSSWSAPAPLRRPRPFVATTKCPSPVICDPDRALFKKYGAERNDPSRLPVPPDAREDDSGPGPGLRTQVGEGSEAQLGGVFIIDTSGKVAYAHIAADAADHPSPQDIVQAAATLTANACRGVGTWKPARPIGSQRWTEGTQVTDATGEVSIPPEVIKAGKTMAFVAYLFFPIRCLREAAGGMHLSCTTHDRRCR